MMSTHPSLWLP
ncbi:helix-turn-helix family protein, partial [Vibrio cholerae HC-56A2]